jgi:hydrogenase maturation factor
MKIGKVPNETLQKIILDKIKNVRSDIALRPKIGEDCSAVDFGENLCVVSTDPITGAVNDIGKLSIHISCNDIASCGVAPVGIMLALLAPSYATECDLENIMSDVCETASALGVDIIGGHTEVTNAVNRFVITSTAIGRSDKGKLVTTSGASPDEDIIMTKTAGIEGTAIISKDNEEYLLKKIDKATIEGAKKFINSISVIKEGIIAGNFGATAMHDITEGGVLGAVWELTEASGTGALIFKDKIPVAYETKTISEIFGIDPLRLISSGSMLITCKNGNSLVEKLEEAGVKASIIGKTTKSLKKIIEINGILEEIPSPGADELYKAVN